jgi:PAS domain-containing protein
MPYFICPRCKTRRVDDDGREGLTTQPPACQKCGFPFMFELLADYYPAQATGFIVCDQDRRVLATGEGVFELTGYSESDLLGRDVAEALGLSDSAAIETVREWGVRKLEQRLSLKTRGGIEKKVKGDFFPAYDEDGGILVALTPA